MAIKKKVRKIPPVKTNDPYVKEGRKPDYKNVEDLKQYMTDRGRILPKSRTGLTAKNQRLVSQSIKRARHLAMLPFVPSVE